MTAVAVTVMPQPKGKRHHQRRTWQAAIVNAVGNLTLRAKRGCWRVVTDRDGELLYDEREPNRPLVANIGDRLLLTHTRLEVDEIAIVDVVGIQPDGWLETLRIRVLAGSISPATRQVFVMLAGKADR